MSLSRQWHLVLVMPLPIWSFQGRRKTDSCGDDPLGYYADDVPLSELEVCILLSGGRLGVSIRCPFAVGFWRTDYDDMFLLRSVFCVETSDSLALVGPVL